jgi:hypothetical protein
MAHCSVRWSRRSFLAWSSAAVAGSSLSTWPARGQGVSLGTVPLSAGYVDGSEEWEDLSPLPWQEGAAPALARALSGDDEPLLVFPADDYSLGDPDLAFGRVRLRVAGLYPGVPSPRDAWFRRVDLRVLFPTFDPELAQTPAYDAWQHRRDVVPVTAPPVAFEVPLREDGGLGLRLEVDLEPWLFGDRNGRVRTVVAEGWFTLGSAAVQPRLQRGLYLLGFSPGMFVGDVELPPVDDPSAWELSSLALSVDPLPAID